MRTTVRNAVLSAMLSSLCFLALGQHEVFKKMKPYRYNITYNNEQLGIHTSEVVTITATGRPWGGDVTQSQITIHYPYTPSDSIACLSLPKVVWVHDATGGIINKPSMFWMLPLRQNQYMMVGASPAPKLKFPITDTMHFVDTVDMRGNWDRLTGCSMIFDYSVAGKETVNNVEYWHIHAIGTFWITNGLMQAGAANVVDYLYNDENGFYSFDYHFYDGSSVSMKREPD